MKNADEVGETIDHCLAFAQLVGIVEVRKVAAGKTRVGVDEGLNYLRVDFIADVRLCERAGTSYPLDAFIVQMNAALDAIAHAKGGWTGTLLPARIAAIVQQLGDTNFPLQLDQAQGLLRILDALIDLGDRRAAALEQTEMFKGVQGATVM